MKKVLRGKLIEKTKCSTETLKRSHTFTCSSIGDPHYKTFSKVNFNYYKPGDWILAESKHFVVSTRTRPWGSVAVNVRLAAKVNKEGEIVEFRAKNFDAIRINKDKVVQLDVGKKYSFYYGGSVIRKSKNQITVISSNGDVVEAFTFDMGEQGRKFKTPNIMNIYMKVSHKSHYTGLCSASNSILKSKDFSKEYVPKDTFVPKPCTGEKRKIIVKRCHKRFKTKFLKHGCVVDLCANMPIDVEKKS